MEIKKPVTITNSEYNLNDLASPRKFEELIHRIYENRIGDDLKLIFDSALLMSGVGEKGIDVLLTTKGKNTGAVQCKMNTSGTISPAMATKEIIKFVLYYYLDNELIYELDKFKYYFVCSGKYSTTALRLLVDFNDRVLNEKNLQLWTEETLKEYEQFSGLDYTEIKPFINRVLTSLNINPISYSNIQGWLNNYTVVVSEFFEIKKVIDNSEFSNGLKEVMSIIDPDLEKKAKPIIFAYKKSAVSHLNSVKFIGHDTVYTRPRNITVSKLYVEPNLNLTSYSRRRGKVEWSDRGNIQAKLKIHNILARSKHHIILGDPGAGKSLLVKNVILTILRGSRKVGGFKLFAKHIPFRIELRKYSEEKQKNNVNIISYLASILETEYQLSNIDVGIVSYIVESNPTLFIFDGLDEIFDVTQKNCVRDDIVNFISINKNVKSIVTSRFIGYHDVSFPEKKFEEFSIQGFDDKQIEKFIKKFYLTQIQNKADRLNEIDNCTNQIRAVDYNLKSNPLILSLMSLLALNKVVIPDSKLEVYRSCTNTLVETRDKDEKQLEFDLKVKSKRGTFGNLAYWQYCQMTNKSIVNRMLAIKSISVYLLNNQFDDGIEAEEAASQFLKYAEGRSIYFDDNFMHKTFLEFYTADYIFTRYHNGFRILERDQILENHITNNAWHTVFELLVAMIDEQIVETDVLDQMLTPQLNKHDIETNFFLLSILKSTTNIGYNVKYQIIKNIILIVQISILNNGKADENITGHRDENKLFRLLNEYTEIEDLLSLIREVLIEIENELKSEEEIIFYSFVYELGISRHFDRDVDFELVNPNKMIMLTQFDERLFMGFFLRKSNEIEDIAELVLLKIKYFGLDKVFNHLHFRFRSSTRWVPLFQIYIRRLEFNSISKLEEDLIKFHEHGLTISVMLEKTKDNGFDWEYVLKPGDKIPLIASLLEQSSKVLIDDFLKYLLNGMNKKSLVSFAESGSAGVKYLVFMEEVSVNYGLTIGK